MTVALAQDTSGKRLAGLKEYLAAYEPCPPAVLELLSQDDDLAVRQSVALNPSAPPGILERLAVRPDGVGDVSDLVARNPSTPEKVLRQLAADWEASVGEVHGANLSVPTSVLRELAASDDVFARLDVADNRSAPADVLEQLNHDEDASCVHWHVGAFPRPPDGGEPQPCLTSDGSALSQAA